MLQSRSRHLSSYYLQDNIFEWHFAIRGPPETEFEVIDSYVGSCITFDNLLDRNGGVTALCREEFTMGGLSCRQIILTSRLLSCS